MPRNPISCVLATLMAVTLLTAAPAGARPVIYLLDPAASTVGFETDFGPDKITGDMPVDSATLRLDFDAVANSQIDVRLGAAKASASFPFAAQALKGPKVLDTADHPDIHFESTRVKATAEGAEVGGNLTIRGVTKPVTLAAIIWRQKGTEAGDLSRLTLRLTGRVNRSDYGATGWADMVGDEVRITITARISRQE
jgi:polyisoprenoid-binding protein YceI